MHRILRFVRSAPAVMAMLVAAVLLPTPPAGAADPISPSAVPGIYTKLLEVDKVDLVVSGYATNQIAPAMPVVMQRGMVFMGLFALAINEQFHYPNYFSIQPVGPDGKVEL